MLIRLSDVNLNLRRGLITTMMGMRWTDTLHIKTQSRLPLNLQQKNLHQKRKQSKMISPFDADLLLSAIGLYLAGVVSGVSGLALFTFLYVGRGNQITIVYDKEM